MKKSFYLVAFMSVVSFSGMRGVQPRSIALPVLPLNEQVVLPNQLVKGQKYKIGQIGQTQEFTYKGYNGSLVGHHFYKKDECQLILCFEGESCSWEKKYEIGVDTRGYWKNKGEFLFTSGGYQVDSGGRIMDVLYNKYLKYKQSSWLSKDFFTKYKLGWQLKTKSFGAAHGGALVTFCLLYKWWKSDDKIKSPFKRKKRLKSIQLIKCGQAL